MTNDHEIWRSGELLAYTEHEGPGRPPAASPTWLTGTLVGVVGVTFAGMLSSDTLCPDHRAWVQTLAGIGFVAMLGALVGLVRGWAAAPLLTLLASSMGVAIGLLDAVHDPTRGRLIALGFGVAFLLAAVASTRLVRMRAWDRRLRVEGELGEDTAADHRLGPVQARPSDVPEHRADEPAGIRADR